MIVWTVTSFEQFSTTEIVSDWTMKILNPPPQADKFKDQTFKTSIPSTVHLILEKAGAIPNPYY